MSDDPDNMEDSGDRPARQKPPKAVTPLRLRQQALRYLDRFAATTMKLRRHLASKNRMAIEFHAMPEDELLAMIDVEIDRLVAAGIVNDQEYATSKARSMARQGKSALQIDVKLHALGFDDDQSEQAARHLRDEEGHSERLAAARYIRKRRFGPFRPAETRHERRPAELASLVRNGFAYHLADSLLDQDRDYLETVIYGPQDGEC